MAGTKQGGFKARDKNVAKHGPGFYAKIGAMGGKKSRGGGFAQGEAGRKRAREYGIIGGTISRRS